jgi:diacylglycerol O-acyltransferase
MRHGCRQWVPRSPRFCARTTRRQNNCSYSTESPDATRQYPTAAVPNPERLSRTDAGFLALEDRRGLHMHAGCVLVFDGVAPGLAQLTERIDSRLDRVPRYRRTAVATGPWLDRAAWVDAPRLALAGHVRHTALAGAADDAELARLAAQVFSARIDRGKPLWELWLIERLAGERFALISKVHHALVDGASNRDLVSLLFDEDAGAPSAGHPPPMSSPGRMLAERLARAARPPRGALETALTLAARAREELEWRDLGPLAALGAPPRSRLNTAVGPDRRYAWVEVGLGRLRKARERLGGTINDAVLTAVAGALGRYLRAHGEDTDGVVLRALVPLADASSGSLIATYVPLPVGIEDPRRRHAEIGRTLDGLRSSGRAVAVEALVERDGFAPPTVISQAARLQAHQRAFNVAVTNIPGPRDARHLLGRELRSIYPALPLARGQALSVAVVSYAGRLCFGLLADADALADLDLLAGQLEQSLGELAKGSRAKRSREQC